MTTFEEKIATLCEMYEMQCSFAKNLVVIKTKVATWHIEHLNGEDLTLFHSNYRFKKTSNTKKANKEMNGFHRQNVSGDIENILSYIDKHDKNFLKPKKNLVDQVLWKQKRRKI